MQPAKSRGHPSPRPPGLTPPPCRPPNLTTVFVASFVAEQRFHILGFALLFHDGGLLGGFSRNVFGEGTDQTSPANMRLLPNGSPRSETADLFAFWATACSDIWAQRPTGSMKYDFPTLSWSKVNDASMMSQQISRLTLSGAFLSMPDSMTHLVYQAHGPPSLVRRRTRLRSSSSVRGPCWANPGSPLAGKERRHPINI